uniref:Gdnf family receptor alpha 1b n=1 Tax=Neogobius melanostomus TaxID=47308 RepID=A0A8C6T3M0_9GOBI
MFFTTLVVVLSLQDVGLSLKGDGASRLAPMDCVKASEQCLKEYSCSTKYRTMRQCVAGKESNFSAVTAPEAQGECRSAIEAMKQSPLYRCRCRRGMKKEKNCLRIFWSIFRSLQGNDLLENSPYEPVNSRLSDIFRLAPIIAGKFCTFAIIT